MLIKQLINGLCSAKKQAPNYEKIKKEFQRISQTPYDVKSYNCMNKSIDFTIAIRNNGGTNFAIVVIPHKDRKYNHAFVRWNSFAYDAASTPAQYHIEYNKYLKSLEKNGFIPMELFETPMG